MTKPKYKVSVPNRELDKITQKLIGDNIKLLTTKEGEHYTTWTVEVLNVRGLDTLDNCQEIASPKAILDKTGEELTNIINNFKLSIASDIQMLEASYGVKISDLNMSRHSSMRLSEYISVGFNTTVK